MYVLRVIQVSHCVIRQVVNVPVQVHPVPLVQDGQVMIILMVPG